MKFIDKLERKFGRFGIPNLTIYMIVCYVIGYALMIVNPGILNWLSLEPAYILRGQVWRLVTWVLYPPSTSGVLWFAIAVLFFYYPIGTSLERTIGTFKYTLYILSGVIFTILGAFILYFLLGGNVLVGNVFSTYYISLSTFLAYAMCYPDMQVLLMFIIPVKMKWMAIFYVDAENYGKFPCHRVVNHMGRLAPGWTEQEWLLKGEGVTLKENGCVDLKKYLWEC